MQRTKKTYRELVAGMLERPLTSADRETLDYLTAREVLEILPSYAPPNAPHKPFVPPNIEDLRQKQARDVKLTGTEVDVLTAYHFWRAGTRLAKDKASANLVLLFGVARTLERLRRAEELARVAKFVRDGYGVTIPPVPDAFVSPSVAERVVTNLYRDEVA